MKILLSWLKEFVDIEYPVDRLSSIFDSLGMGVEELIYLSDGLKKYVLTGEVTSVKEHPSSDNLKIAEVTLGSNSLRVVTGAPNVKVGKKYPLALEGAVLPGGNTVRKKIIDGVESQAVLLSEEDLNLDDHSEGILELSNDCKVGESPLSQLGLDDWLFDLEIFANRPDLLSIIGIAYEIASKENLKVKFPRFDIEEEPIKCVGIRIETKDACPRYTGRIIKEVKVGKSPFWLRRRLRFLGINTINNIVDITNYVMLELGHPLHAFDLSMVDGDICIRWAKEEEKIVTLDGIERELSPDILVIADRGKPIALAGIMGGENSGISEDSKDIFIESAYFTPWAIKRGCNILNLETESSIRFSKGADITSPPLASNRVSYLIKKTVGGSIGPLVDKCYIDTSPKRIIVNSKKIKDILGYTPKKESYIPAFRVQGITVEGKDGSLEVTVPTRRRDINIEEDIVEEILRIDGYQKLKPKRSKIEEPIGKKLDELDDILRNNLIALGFSEIISTGFLGEEDRERFNFEPGVLVKIKNPLSSAFKYMRPSLLPSIIRTIDHNLRMGNQTLRLFEIGNAFSNRGKDELPQENKKLCLCVCGRREEFWSEEKGFLDYYDIKGALDLISEKLQVDFVLKDINIPFFDKVKSIHLSREEIGWIGEVSSNILKAYDIKSPVYAMELNIGTFSIPQTGYKRLQVFPSIRRDISVVIQDEDEYKELEEVIREAGVNLLKDLKVIDVYRGSPLKEGERSITLSLRFHHTERTLQDEEVDREMEKLMKKLKEKGFGIRGIDGIQR